MTTAGVRQEINAFIAAPRMALVGVSRNEQEFGHRLFSDMRKWGYNVVAINPNAPSIAGTNSYPRVQDVGQPINAALLLTPPAANEQLVRDCAEAGIQRVWFYGVSDRSSENATAIEFCRQHGIAVVPGYCPYMFLPQAPFFHGIHRFVARLTGQYPQ